MIRNGLPYNIAQTHSRKFIESSTTKTAKAFNLGQTISKNSGLCKFLYQSIYGRKGDETADPKLFPTASSNHRSTKRSRDRPRLGVACCHEMVRPACGYPARSWPTSECLAARSLFQQENYDAQRRFAPTFTSVALFKLQHAPFVGFHKVPTHQERPPPKDALIAQNTDLNDTYGS